MKSKLTANGKIRGRPPKGSKEEVQEMPPARRSGPLTTEDIIRAELSKQRHFAKLQARDADSADEQERIIETDRRRFARHRKRFGLKK